MSSGALIVVLALKLLALQNETNLPTNTTDTYYELPRFWTSTGFCPAGEINRKSIRDTLLSDAVLLNLRHISALPKGAITHVRIHWMLELIEFTAFTQAGVPIYDFDDLDTFIWYLDELGLYPVVEFMANPGNVFFKNPNRNDVYWQDFSYQVVRRYLNTLGAAKLLQWRFESWNEPDVTNYNRLNFTVDTYLTYMQSLHRGLADAGHRSTQSLHFPLRGPAGLFKSPVKHPLCWSLLQLCDAQPSDCPLELLSYHRKGNGSAAQLLQASAALITQIFDAYPGLKALPLSNSEADPIASWSTARPLHADVRYAVTLIRIVLEHWRAMLQQPNFARFESLSHDNAFLSYHPYEFAQRTLLAHFRMNASEQPHSQFIQKPVYAALGLLSKLAPLGTDLQQLSTPSGDTLTLLKTKVADAEPLYLCWLLIPDALSRTAGGGRQSFTLQLQLPLPLTSTESFGIALETLAQERTDPAWVWRKYGSPAYPNATIREHMRRAQSPEWHVMPTPRQLSTTSLLQLHIDYKLPWVMLLRTCSDRWPVPAPPQRLDVTGITSGEVLLTWHESPQAPPRCLRTYEVWYKAAQEWLMITRTWHVPFGSFHYAPQDKVVNGFYKVRALDIFERHSGYSASYEYIEL